MKVTVLMGGWSAEREVSLVSGKGIAGAARALGHSVTELDMGAAPADGATLAERLLATKPDVVFNALHGTPGEDGTVQGLMDLLGLKYTHSGVTTSAVAIDKELTKKMLVPAGVRMPGGRIVASESLYERDPLPRPYVLKPVNEGSSVGVAIVTAESNYGTPIASNAPGPWQQYPQLLAEPFIAGLELTVAVLDHLPTGIGEPLAVTELKPDTGFYDYEAKYTDGRTTHICPAQIPPLVTVAALEQAALAHRVLGCRGVSRSDFRYDPSEGPNGLYLLEVNTQPGMTPLSLVPEQARVRGISYEALVGRLIESALA
ncbi:D-alanine--D-alanine ligase [Sandaracinobacter sp. RS1-74]|uniref:D-alanine--D-alanine ligase n=1 Tax=Sandaracinobacteroides sayramensis TaxID=2913411 RepID=UPI001EDBBFEA|nr:D-alanine--D-alanine ligase [Sandaracinobacteroides sayramensis]MCG2840472.1 D-alanine--D-alanine ligase [Sandaracinobacteroides sayramensis]